MKKLVFKTIMSSIAVIVIVYLASSFIVMDFNPVNWDTYLRLMSVVCVLYFLFIIIGDFLDEYDHYE